MEDWWADPVKEIYREALAALGGDDAPLKHGPGHVVWCDGNFTDDDVRFALAACDSRHTEWVTKFGGAALAVVRRSIERLLAVPESVRDADDPHTQD